MEIGSLPKVSGIMIKMIKELGRRMGEYSRESFSKLEDVKEDPNRAEKRVTDFKNTVQKSTVEEE